MTDLISMSSRDLRLKDVPNLEELEKIEDYTDKEDRVGELFQTFVQDEILGRLVEQDDRYDESRDTLGGHLIEYGDVKGDLDAKFGSINGTVFDPEERDMDAKDLAYIGGASTGKTMNSRAIRKYSTALENAGYQVEDSSKEGIIDAAETALEEIDRQRFSIDIEGSTREAYEEAVEKIEDYREQV